jgi:hypothetical protein
LFCRNLGLHARECGLDNRVGRGGRAGRIARNGWSEQSSLGFWEPWVFDDKLKIPTLIALESGGGLIRKPKDAGRKNQVVQNGANRGRF